MASEQPSCAIRWYIARFTGTTHGWLITRRSNAFARPLRTAQYDTLVHATSLEPGARTAAASERLGGVTLEYWT
jgi:hypothetical protein